MKQLTHGSLFAGIGGFDLGFERAGMKTIWQVEIDEYCRRVLEKHWPTVRRYADARYVHGNFACPKWGIERDCPDCLAPVDVLTAGTPCQPSSRAGEQRFEEDDRWLWDETIRIIFELGPRYVLLENPTGLLDGGIARVLGNLSEIGFDAEWATIPSAALGGPTLRERVLILAYPTSKRQQGPRGLWNEINPTPDSYREATDVVDAFQRKALPFVCGGHYGLPKGLGECSLKALGNAIDPNLAEWIGKQILGACNG